MQFLSGFAKFDVNIELTCDQFVTLVNTLSTQEGAFSEAKFNEIMDAMEKALNQ